MIDELRDEVYPSTFKKGNVELKNVSARYEINKELVLKNISFKAKGGSKIGVVGRTGSGKSSLIKLFWRYLQITEGEILIDEQNICKMDLKLLRRELTIITQDTVILNGSLQESIDPTGKYLRSKASRERMMNLLLELGFKNSDFLKNGLQMKLKESGSNLSQGEKQLICFARALSHKTKIVLFDEATASIDIKTEEAFQKIIQREFEDSTIFIIAHRL